MRRHTLPTEVYELVERMPAVVLLENGRGICSTAEEKPWTRLFVAPARLCIAHRPEEIPALFRALESALAQGWCAAGFFSYECGIRFEPKAAMRPGSEGQPLAWFGLYDRSYVFDHATGRFVDGAPPELAAFRGQGKATGRDSAPTPEMRNAFALSESDYTAHIDAIHKLIRAGDVYQLNFTAPFRLETRESAAALYARLRARQPVDYGAFLHWEPGRFLQSFSPELFFRLESDGVSRRIVTRPMKGTAPRGRTAHEDRALAEWLRNDPKNRAENVMIVDLLRNDLGRVARVGSVRAEPLFAVERYRTLWQMTSTVRAELRPDVDFHAVFRALFPSGSVTGAPKVRAMQAIAGLENGPRGVYTGAIGYFSPQETLFNVAIRTLALESGPTGLCGAMGSGSGIVIDSEPAAEYRECLLKAEFLRGGEQQWPEQFSLVESLLWQGAYPLIALHLDRLTDSASYFDFPCEREAVREALDHYAEQFTDGLPRKVRFLLDAEGVFAISDEILPASRTHPATVRVRIAAERTDPADAMLFHKTTHRPLYARAFEQAVKEGCADALFFNLRGELTEGAISNVFVEKDGRWFTPPVACGLLAGVYRQHLLATRPEIEERVLTCDDLLGADATYLANAVRGLRRVVLAG